MDAAAAALDDAPVDGAGAADHLQVAPSDIGSIGSIEVFVVLRIW